VPVLIEEVYALLAGVVAAYVAPTFRSADVTWSAAVRLLDSGGPDGSGPETGACYPDTGRDAALFFVTPASRAGLPLLCRGTTCRALCPWTGTRVLPLYLLTFRSADTRRDRCRPLSFAVRESPEGPLQASTA
jgi:hypothetical protein